MVGHTTKHMTHGSSWDMEIGPPSVEDVTLTTVRHLLTARHQSSQVTNSLLDATHPENYFF